MAWHYVCVSKEKRKKTIDRPAKIRMIVQNRYSEKFEKKKINGEALSWALQAAELWYWVQAAGVSPIHLKEPNW